MSVTPTMSPTITSSMSSTMTESITASMTQSISSTMSPTLTQSMSPSMSMSVTPTMSPTLSSSMTATLTESITASMSPSVTSSMSPTLTQSITASMSPSVTLSMTPTLTPSITLSMSPTVSSSMSPSVTLSMSPTVSSSMTATLTESITASMSPSVSMSVTPTISPSVTLSLSPTLSSTLTQSITSSMTQSLTPSTSPSLSMSVTSSMSPSMTMSMTPSISPSPTNTDIFYFDTIIRFIYNGMHDTSSSNNYGAFSLKQIEFYDINDNKISIPSLTDVYILHNGRFNVLAGDISSVLFDGDVINSGISWTPRSSSEPENYVSVGEELFEVRIPGEYQSEIYKIRIYYNRPKSTPGMIIKDTFGNSLGSHIKSTSSATTPNPYTRDVIINWNNYIAPTPSISMSPSMSATSHAMTPSMSMSVTPTMTESISSTMSSTLTESMSPSLSMSVTPTLTQSISSTMSSTLTESITASMSPSITLSNTPSMTLSMSPSLSMSVTPTLTQSISSSMSSTMTESITPTMTESISSTMSSTLTQSMSPSLSMSVTPTMTQSISSTMSSTMTESISLSMSMSPSISPSITLSNTLSMTQSMSPSMSPSITLSNTPSMTQSMSPSMSPSVTLTMSPTLSSSMSPSVTLTMSPTLSSSMSSTLTESITASMSSSVTLSMSVTPSMTESITASMSPSVTLSMSVTPSMTESITASMSSTLTESITASMSSTMTESITASMSPSVTLSMTPSLTLSMSPSMSPSITLSMTPNVTSAQLFSDLSVSNYTKSVDNGGFDLYFTPSGNKFYTISNAVNTSNSGRIYEYTMTTNWQPSTSGSPSIYTLVNYNGSVKYFNSFTFNSDGSKLFVIGRQNGSSKECDIWRYSLSTGYDVSSASFDGTTRLAKSGGRAFRIESINFNDDGSKVFMLNKGSNSNYVSFNGIYEITLSSSYDLTELSNKDISTYCDASLDFDTLLSTSEPMSFRFADSGKYIYITGYYSSTEFTGIIIDISSSAYDISGVTSSNILENTSNTDTELYMLKPLYNSSLPKIFMEPLNSNSSIFLNTGTYVYSREFNGNNPFSGQSVTPYYEYNIIVTQVTHSNGIAGLTEVHFVDSEGAPRYLYDLEAVLGGATSVPSGTGYSAGDSVSIPINNYQQEATSGRLVWPASNAGVNDMLLTLKVPAYYTPSNDMGGIRIYWEMQARRPAVKITDSNGNVLGTDSRGSTNTSVRPHARTIYFSY